MKKPNQSESAITAKAITAATEKVRAARDGMPFLTALTPKERKAVPRPTAAGLALMEDALQGVRENPGVMPATLDLATYAIEVEACRGLFTLLKQLQQLTADVQDTLWTIHRQAHNTTTQVRVIIKSMAKTKPTPGLKLLSERLNPASVRPAETAEPSVPTPTPTPTPTPAPAPAPVSAPAASSPAVPVSPGNAPPETKVA